MQHLRGVVRVRTRLSHRPSVGSRFPAMIENREPSVGIARLRQSNGQSKRTIPVMLLVTLLGCGPRAHIPVRPIFLQGALAQTDSGAILARSLAPVLYLQRDERFRLSRAVAVVHPTRRDRKSTRLNSSHGYISYAVFCLKKKTKKQTQHA